ncbi:MAG TPA: DUF305 domain-containing protein [Deinococcales bacterium]|nr:DUF305 domain-containing protein [Deinococcales bacterium]
MNPMIRNKFVAALVLTGALGATALVAAQSQPAGRGYYGGMMGGQVGRNLAVNGEAGYITEMIPHHLEAIRAAQALLAGTARPEMKALARSIIDTQTREVAQLKGWLAAWYPKATGSANYSPMMRDLSGLKGDALDQAFLEDMIPHHMQAVMMSMHLLMLGQGVHPQLVSFAQNVASAQAKEVGQMRADYAQWFGAAATGRAGNGFGAGMMGGNGNSYGPGAGMMGGNGFGYGPRGMMGGRGR